MAKSKYQVRFHLGAGKHYKHWQIRQGDNVSYYHPDEVCIMMKQCKLRNRKSVAKQIFAGSHKTVCAWIECDELWLNQHSEIVGQAAQISYNPKVAPYWVQNGEDVDGKVYNLLHTHNRSVYCPVI